LGELASLSDFALLSLVGKKSDETSAKCNMGADFLRCHYTIETFCAIRGFLLKVNNKAGTEFHRLENLLRCFFPC
jgi:hypothetical protein